MVESPEEGGRTSGPRLKPAMADVDAKQPYMPSIPWKWIFLAASALGLLGSVLFYMGRKEQVKTRTQIVGTIDGPLAEPAKAYQQFRGKLESWIIDAAKSSPPEKKVDPRLRFSELHKAKGLYLRLRTDQADSPAAIAGAIKNFKVDAIPKCLGIAPVSLRTFYSQGEFLLPSWIEAAKNETQASRLEALKMDLELRGKRDLPNLMAQIDSDYFLLVLQRGESRREEPVDVFLWDLRKDILLLSMRTVANGKLVPVRLAARLATKPRSTYTAPPPTIVASRPH